MNVHLLMNRLISSGWNKRLMTRVWLETLEEQTSQRDVREVQETVVLRMISAGLCVRLMLFFIMLWRSKTTESLWTRFSLTSLFISSRAAATDPRPAIAQFQLNEQKRLCEVTSVRQPTENLLRKVSNRAAALKLKTETGNKNAFRYIRAEPLTNTRNDQYQRSQISALKSQESPSDRKVTGTNQRAAAETLWFRQWLFFSRRKQPTNVPLASNTQKHPGIKTKRPHRRTPLVYRTGDGVQIPSSGKTNWSDAVWHMKNSWKSTWLNSSETFSDDQTIDEAPDS